MRDIALNFSRPGGQVVSQYYNFIKLGKEGYEKIHSTCYLTAQYLAQEVENMGFEIIYGGEMDEGIPALCWKIKEGTNPNFNLFDFADVLKTRGWQVPAYALPDKCKDVVIQRILVRRGVSRDLATLLVDDMKRALEHFEKNPVQTKSDGSETSGFHH